METIAAAAILRDGLSTPDVLPPPEDLDYLRQ